jgi:hypothetical protein
VRVVTGAGRGALIERIAKERGDLTSSSTTSGVGTISPRGARRCGSIRSRTVC